MHRGKLGNWLAVRMGNDLHEMDKGIIPNQTRSGAESFKTVTKSQVGWFHPFLPPQG